MIWDLPIYYDFQVQHQCDLWPFDHFNDPWRGAQVSTTYIVLTGLVKIRVQWGWNFGVNSKTFFLLQFCCAYYGGYGVISITQVFCVLGDNGVKNTLGDTDSWYEIYLQYVVNSLGFEVPKTSRKKIKRNTIRSSSCSRDLKIFGKCKI